MSTTYVAIPQITLKRRGSIQHDLSTLVQTCMDMDTDILIINRGIVPYATKESFASTVRGLFIKAKHNVTVDVIRHDETRIVLIKH